MTLSSTSLVQPEQFLLELWQQNQGAISRTLMASEADPAARQDLKQDIYLALHQSAERIQAAELPRAYLFRIVHNVTVDHIARAKRQRRGPGWPGRGSGGGRGRRRVHPRIVRTQSGRLQGLASH